MFDCQDWRAITATDIVSEAQRFKAESRESSAWRVVIRPLEIQSSFETGGEENRVAVNRKDRTIISRDRFVSILSHGIQMENLISRRSLTGCNNNWCRNDDKI